MSIGAPWGLDPAAARAQIAAAFEAGVNFFDTADVYGRGASEEILGATLKEIASREDVVLASKVFMPAAPGPNRAGLGRKHVIASLEASLRRLQTDHLDLYQIHRFDPETPVEETLGVLDALVKAGKVRYIGACSMRAWQFMRLLGTSDVRALTRFVSMQNHYNLLYREEEREMLPLCCSEGVGVLAWSPLARGVLARSGTTARAEGDRIAGTWYPTGAARDAILGAVHAIAAERRVSAAQVSLAWLLARPAVTSTVVGISKPHHLEDAVRAVELKLSADEVARLSAPYVTRPVTGIDPPWR
jgi:aryl-alcohol dehydrogenase-like predicted oxidoreductase